MVATAAARNLIDWTESHVKQNLPPENAREISSSTPEPLESPSAPKGAGRFLRFSLIYAFGDLLAKGARIVLIPFYLAAMTQSEIGELAVLQAIIFGAWTLLGFGLAFGGQKFYHQYEDKGDELFSSLWLARLIGGLPFYGLLMAAGYGFYLFSDRSITLNLILLAVTAGYLRGGINIVEHWLNIREEPIKYRAFTFSQFLLTTLLILYLVVGRKMGVAGVVWGELVSYSLFVVFSAVLLFRKALPNLRAVRWGEIIGYCAPALPHMFFMWGIMGIDRLILNVYVPKSEIGIYSVGFLLGSFLSIVVRSMRAAWLPTYFKNADGADSAKQFGKIASIYLFISCFTALCGMCFAAELIYLFSLTSAVSYAQSAQVMQYVLFGFVCMSLFIAINQPLFYEGRTGVLSSISGFGLLVNVLVNVSLIPLMGIWGAAIACIMAYLTMTLVTFVVTNRIYKVVWETSAILSTAGCFVLFGAGACLLPAEPVLWIVPGKILLVVFFPLITLFRVRVSNDSVITLESRYGWTQNVTARWARKPT